MKKLLVTFLLVSFTFSASAQSNLDSLWGVWSNTELDDTTRLRGLNTFIWDGFVFKHPDSAIQLANLQLEFAKSVTDSSWVAASYHVLGVANFFIKDKESATQFFEKALEIQKLRGDLPNVSRLLKNIGNVLKSEGKYEDAIDLYVQSLSIEEQIGDSVQMAILLSGLGNIANSQGDLIKSLEYKERALVIRRKLGDIRGEARILHGIAVIYNKRGMVDKAIETYHRALELFEKEGDLIASGVVLNIGTIHMRLGSLDTAEFYFSNCLGMAKDMDEPELIFDALYQLSRLERTRDNHLKSVEYAETAIQIVQEIGVVKKVSKTAQILYEGYKQLGNEQKALEMYELHISSRDSLESEENQRAVLREQYKYSYEKEALTDSLGFAKKEAVLTERTEKQQIGLAAAGGGLILVLALAFTIYSGKKKSDELLLNILPEETARELKAKGSADAKLIDEVTVLFTDFKGLTAMSEQLSPKELVKDLHECFSAFDGICERHGIEKIKTIGDAYMAAGGLPTPNQTHPQDVVKAALEMAEVVEQGKAKKIADGDPYFEIRIGVHTGPVVAGIVGIKKFQYDIWGDTVNTASRMESSGEVGKVNISEATYKLLKDDASFSFSSRGKIEAKGKGKMEMYFVANQVT